MPIPHCRTGFALQLAAVLTVSGSVLPKSVAGQRSDATLAFDGNVGFRIEYIANESFAETGVTADDDHRLRIRIRARFGAHFQPSHIVTAGLRLSTGAADFPSSGWSSLNELFNRHAFLLDRAFVRIMPLDALELRLGLDENPAFRISEMVWDDDVSPGGMTEILRLGAAELVAGQYMLREVRTSKPANQGSAFLFINGLALKGGNRTEWRLGAYHYLYARADAIAAALDGGELNGEFKTNRVAPTDPAAYFSGYSTVTTVAWIARGKWRLSAEAALNLAAERDPTLGAAYERREDFAAGGLVRYGDSSPPWGWSVEAGFFHIEADAVIAAFNSDDLQQTNVNAIPIWLRLTLPGGAALVSDTYIQRKVNVDLASSGGVVHGENATKVRTRLSLQAGF